MEMRPDPSGPSRSGPDLSFLARFWAVYTSPRTLFLSLRDRPRILGALVLLLVIGAVSAVLVSGVVVESQLQALRGKPDTTPEQIAGAEKVFRVLIPSVIVLAAPFLALIGSAALLLIANVFLGGRTTYRRLFSAMLHIQLIGLPALLVKAPLVLAKQDINVQTSLAAFLPAAQQKTFLYQLLAQTDLFTLWMWGLSILAVSILAGIPPRRVGVVLGAIWVVLSLLGAALGSLG